MFDQVTSDFTGFVGIVDGEKSWIARYIGCSHMPSAVYAIELMSEDEEQEPEAASSEEYDQDFPE